MSTSPVTPADILDFWFEEAGPQRWYAVSQSFDDIVRRRFAKAIEQEALPLRSGVHSWTETPDGAFALIILFDQFTRNVWRGSNKAFEFDPLALNLAREMIERGFDWAVPDERRAFVYMPFMHSERIEDQDLCVGYAGERLSDKSTLDHAIKHREVIRQFGRFPYRNDALGRASTSEEIAYLDNGGYAPGRKR